MLALGELTRAGLNQLDRRWQGSQSLEVIDDFFISERLPSGLAHWLVAGNKPLNLGGEAGTEHVVDATIDSFVKPVARRGQPEDVSWTFVFRKWLLKLLH